MIQLESDGVRWELQPGFAPLLWKVLSSAGATIKESPAKRVAVHEAAGRKFFVKRYRHEAVLLRPLKFFFKMSQARQEWGLARELERLGIPIVAHVALGERWGLGLRESILVTEGFAGVPLDETRDANPEAVTEFVRRLHEHGVLQRDLHAGNILVSAAGELRLVDLHGTVVKRSLTATERAVNLARLRVSLPLPVPAAVEALSTEMRRELLRERSRRCLRHNREFAPQRAGGMSWRVRLPFLSREVQSILDAPDEFLQSRARLWKAGRTATVGRADGLVLKRFNLRKIESLVVNLFRASRARRAFRAAYHLELAGIPTARPIAMAERRVGRFLLRSYLLMEEIAGATDLGAYLKSGRAPDAKVVESTARLVAKLHDEGFSHRDLKETNLVLGGDGEPCLLDLDGLKFVGVVPERRAAADLERLNRGVSRFAGVTRAERRQFLRVYCAVRKLRRVPRLD